MHEVLQVWRHSRYWQTQIIKHREWWENINRIANLMICNNYLVILGDTSSIHLRESHDTYMYCKSYYIYIKYMRKYGETLIRNHQYIINLYITRAAMPLLFGLGTHEGHHNSFTHTQTHHMTALDETSSCAAYTFRCGRTSSGSCRGSAGTGGRFLFWKHSKPYLSSNPVSPYNQLHAPIASYEPSWTNPI